jgi:hypothetical protein
MHAEFHIYFDHYVSPKYYGGIKSSDLKHSQDVSATMPFPKGFWHGTVLRVPTDLVNHLSSLNHNSTTKDQL